MSQNKIDQNKNNPDSNNKGKILLVGFGPGAEAHMSVRALQAIEAFQVVRRERQRPADRTRRARPTEECGHGTVAEHSAARDLGHESIDLPLERCHRAAYVAAVRAGACEWVLPVVGTPHTIPHGSGEPVRPKPPVVESR